MESFTPPEDFRISKEDKWGLTAL